MSPFMELAKKHSLSILSHAYLHDLADPINYLKLAQEYPVVNICIARAGGSIEYFYHELEGSKLSNVFIDIAPLTVLCRLHDRIRLLAAIKNLIWIIQDLQQSLKT